MKSDESNENEVACDYEAMYKRIENENKDLNKRLNEQMEESGRTICLLRNNIEKTEKENKWLKDIINSILNI